MLLKKNDITIAVLHDSKHPVYNCSVYNKSECLYKCSVDMDSWNLSELNDLQSYLVNHGMYDLWSDLVELTDTVDVILANVTHVVDYGIRSGADIYFGDNVFRLDKDGNISSKAFQIWYIGTMQRIPAIKEYEWKEFVVACLKIAEKKYYDPLSPDVIGSLISILKSGEIHDEFCDALAREVISNSSGTYFVYQRENDHVLFVPKHICLGIAKNLMIGQKKLRQYLEPFLDKRIEDNVYIGTHLKFSEKPRKRFWLFSMEKLVDYDPTLSSVFKNVIDCEHEHEEVVHIEQ